MPTPAQSRQALANPQQLYAPPPRLHKRADPPAVMAMLRDASAALAGRLSAWGPHRPDPADVAEAQRQAAGIARLLAELSGGPADGAA